MEGNGSLTPIKSKFNMPKLSRNVPESEFSLDVKQAPKIEDRHINLQLGPRDEHGTINNKAKFLCIILIVIGIGLIIGGSVAYLISGQTNSSVTFWVIGAIVLVPGLFVAWKLLKVWRNNNYEDRVKIQQEIPGWN